MDIHIGDKAADGSQLRPFIVWFGEAVPKIEQAAEEAMKADIFVVIGTSLNVYPAAGLVRYYKGNRLALVNLSETPYDSYADLVIHEKIGEVFSQIRAES
jgi:NAD-dependent deacetylase